MMGQMSSPTALPAEDFEALRPFLFGIAYRMTGSATDAEDIVQESWIRARRAPGPGPASPRAYFATIVSRLSLDHLRSARVQREQYIGPWLPEPILSSRPPQGIDPQAIADARETLSFGFMVLLERLSPLERAVFVLHEAFDFRHAEIADALEITDAGSRQHLRRARKRLAEGRPRFRPSPEQHAAVTRRFLEAVGSGDVSHIASMLAEDAAVVTDSGGKVPAALNAVRGRMAAARLLVGIRNKLPPERVEFVTVNGLAAAIVWQGGIRSVFVADTGADGLVHALWVLRNPEKLPPA